MVDGGVDLAMLDDVEPSSTPQRQRAAASSATSLSVRDSPIQYLG